MPTLSAIKTPGVYVEEIPAFPPAIAQVATAIPVFIGYTQFAIDDKGNSLTNVPFKISSALEYKTFFGEAYSDLETIVILNPDNSVNNVSATPLFQMYNAVSMFFFNGGNDCYILSIGNYNSGQAKLDDYKINTPPSCFDILKKYDEPTLIVIPDAAVMLVTIDFNSLMQAALKHCGDMQSRFTIIDVPQTDEQHLLPNSTDIENIVGTDSNTFRNGIVGLNLNYGAAYYPYLQTNLPSPSSYTSIILNDSFGNKLQLDNILPANNINVLQIINVGLDQSTYVLPYIGIPISTTANPTYSVIDYNNPINGVANLIKAQGKDMSITDAYNSLNSITPLKNELEVKIQFIINVLDNFFNLNSSFKDKPDASGYYTPPPPVTQNNTLVAWGSTIKDIHSIYVKAGTTTSQSPFEKLLIILIEIDEHYPVGGPLGIIDKNKAQGWFGNSYLTIMPLPDNPNIYGATPPTDDKAAVNAVMPIVDNIFNTLISMISNFSADVTNRLNSLDLTLTSNYAVYKNIKAAIKNTGLIVPPSGAMAGVYAATDGNRGVWKAPANVALLNVIKPTIPIDDDLQEDLNIDPNSGKSINAIRAFTGKGTLVWGARTLTGNDNDFRYISVRRFFIMVEQSVKLAAFQFVFEPNDANTWTRIRAMIENYLTLLWREGALAGAKPEQAFYVSVGLGKTMIFDDILNGRLIVEIGMAPVRPAEFIILRFTQIQQTS